MNVQAILSDWDKGLTSGEILAKYKLTQAQEYALTNCSAGLTIEQIKQRLPAVKPDMSAKEINDVMGGNK